MTPRRRLAPPPELPDFTYVEPLGSGGFADVHLFEQHNPRRRVAIKVLHADRMNDTSAVEFAAEANLMALLSSHPSIVTIYSVGEAPDGRPYLVMEYAPRPNLQVRYKRAPFSVAEALRVGIQVSAAVETAHRAGIMHRDIKPANILVTEYNHPALTDFGIASTSPGDIASGLSIPWSAPEMFADKPFGGPEADVYALAATVFTLLAGHSPFEPEGSVSSLDLIDRIERAPAPHLTRPDVPAALDEALVRAMAKNPDDRHPSALAFARALQRVQIDLSLDVTPIDIIDDHAGRELEDGEEDGLTRVRGVTSIAPAPLPAPAPIGGFARVSPAPEVVHVSRPAVAVAEAPSPTAQPTSGESALAVEPRRVRRAAAQRARRRLWHEPKARRRLIVGGAALVLVIGAASIVAPMLIPEQRAETLPKPQSITLDLPPRAEDLRGEKVGNQARFTWVNPDEKSGDRYMWAYTGVGVTDTDPHLVDAAEVTVPLLDGAQTCIVVTIRRDDGSGAGNPADACVTN